jgi:hypothetical protein
MMRINFFTVILFALVFFVKAEEPGKRSTHFIMGTPWYSDFLEEDDVVVKPSKKTSMTSKRRKGTAEKPKEISAKKMKKAVNGKDNGGKS